VDLLLQSIAAAVLCALGTWLGWHFFTTTSGTSLLWPSSGIALALLMRGGWRLGPAIWLGGLAALWALRLPPVEAVCLATSSVAGAALARASLQGLAFQADLKHRRDLGLLLLCAVLAGPLLATLMGSLPALAQATSLDEGRLRMLLLSSWAGHALAALLCCSPMLMWMQRKPAARHSRRGHWPVALTLSCLAVSVWAAWEAASGATHEPAACWAAAMGVGLLPLLLIASTSPLQQQLQQLQETLEARGVSVAQWDLDRGELEATGLWRSLLIADEDATAPLQWLEEIHPLERERASQALTELMAGLDAEEDTHYRDTLRLRQGSSDWRWVDVHAQVPQRRTNQHKGQASRLLITLEDVSWRQTALERQRMSASLFQHLHEGLLITDTDFVVLDANPSYCRLMNLPREALIGRTADPLSAANLLRAGIDQRRLREEIAEKGVWESMVQAQRAQGEPCKLQLTVSAIPEPSGPQRYHVVTVSDLTQILEHERQLQRQARFDELTGLPNHSEFVRLLNQGMRASQQEGFRLIICCLDLDHFKQVNVRHGREIGDATLVEVAKRLQSALRSSPEWSDVVARLGGDEFALLLRGRQPEEVQPALERIVSVLRAPFQPSGATQAITLTGSIGATLYPRDKSDAETLLRHAAYALYQVKQSQRDGVEIFDTEMRMQDEARGQAIGRLQTALDEGELQLHYQPKIEMRSGRVIGMEALMRWNHPERGLLMPGAFLPMVEHTGFSARLGDWVIEQALQQSAQWLAAGLTLRLSVNIGARHLQMPDFAQRLQELAARHQAPVAQHLTLELLESAALADLDATLQLVQQLQATGVHLALDDFGTGFSTLTYLKRLSVDLLKIDRSFVQNMLIDPHDRALVEGVVSLSKSFDCAVIAEGVESMAHARALLKMGCELGQGSAIASAMPATHVPGWVSAFEHGDWVSRISASTMAANGPV